MKLHWLHHRQNHELIVFFSGWGSDAPPFKPIDSKDYDVLMFYDYRDIALPVDFDELLGQYNQVHLLAWSLGVWVANSLCGNHRHLFKSAVAINGTLNPIDDSEGIPKAIFDGTLQNLSAGNLQKFNRRMFTNARERVVFESYAPLRHWEELRDELAHLQMRVQSVPNMVFGRAVVAGDDLIFSASNQQRAWACQLEICCIGGGHFPFYGFALWDDILYRFYRNKPI